MRCAECQRPISPRDQKRARVVKDEQGRVKAAYHARCGRIAAAHDKQSGPMPGNRYHDWAPGAYEMTVQNRDDLSLEEQARRDRAAEEAARLREIQRQRAEDREDEEVPQRWDDQRDPVTADLEDLIVSEGPATVVEPGKEVRNRSR